MYFYLSRDDGLCGELDGEVVGCEHIPPFPTCCQSNGHCGWDCDDGNISKIYGKTLNIIIVNFPKWGKNVLNATLQ